QLFVDGDRVQRARIPREGYFHMGAFAGETRARVMYSPDDLKGRRVNHAELLLYFVWNEGRRHVQHVDEKNGILTLDAPIYSPMVPDRYVVENTPDGLAEKGSWCFDPGKGEIQWHPADEAGAAKAEVVVPLLNELVRFQGRKGKPVRHITLSGMTFAHTDWFECDSGNQSAVAIGSAISFERAESCSLLGNRIVNVGTYAVGLYRGCRLNRIEDNVISKAGAGGVRIGGEAPDESTRENVVAGNDIFECGQIYPSGIGVWIGQSSGNRVARNRIHDLPYTGISVGWTWGPGPNTHKANRIEGNTVERVMRLLHDGGAIYLLGESYGTEVKGNVIRDVGGSGSGVYLDEGCTGVRVSGNRIARCAVAFALHGARDNLFDGNGVTGMEDCTISMSNCQSYMADNRFRRNRFQSESKALFIKANGWTRRFVIEMTENEFQGACAWRIEGVPNLETAKDWMRAWKRPR
ncbi:MAG: right-handed parallel beta-helix repeat-containing protein, partial [Kiritimatiellae bacterium]|nr:right-handed parallel beta-helix repeat-containing protein [Kiritimatiellia bacterium]